MVEKSWCNTLPIFMYRVLSEGSTSSPFTNSMLLLLCLKLAAWGYVAMLTMCLSGLTKNGLSAAVRSSSCVAGAMAPYRKCISLPMSSGKSSTLPRNCSLTCFNAVSMAYERLAGGMPFAILSSADLP